MKSRIINRLIAGLLLICFGLFPLMGYTATLGEQQIRSAVETWVRHVTADAKLDATIMQMEPYQVNGETMAYIAHISGGGFCLCGANDLVLPVYLYCPSGTYDPENPETQFILKEISTRTEALIKGIAENDPNITQYRSTLLERAFYWNQLMSGMVPRKLQDVDNRTEPDSMKLGLTCQWGQGSPYNTLCPSLTATERTVVGCTATATAQIFYYWKLPTTGSGEDSVFYNYRWRTTWDQEPLSTDPGIPENWGGGNRLDWSSGSGGRLWMNGYWDGSVYNSAYWLNTGTNYRTALNSLWSRMNLSSTRCYVNLGTATYNWSILQDRHYHPPSGAGDDEVAELSYHVAVAINSNFGIWGTGGGSTQCIDAMENNFDYDTDATWGPKNLNTMVEDIQWFRPFIFTGSDSSEGHAWVLAGYNKNTSPWQFYMNMGWYGNGDGWYSCDSVPGNLNYFHAHITQIAPENSVKFVGNTTSGDGSPDSPYQNIEAALASVPNNATLIFKAGSTNTFMADSLTINQPLTLKGWDITIHRQ